MLTQLLNSPAPSENLGFCYNVSSAHLARTIMLDELDLLLSYVSDHSASQQDYKDAIITYNCLGKRSGKTRTLTFKHLVELYGLDTSIPLFKALLYFWNRDTQSRPLLAILLASTRDPLLRQSAPFIAKLPKDTILKRETMEAFVVSLYPDRYSPATLKSTAQNINASWTKTGHLSGRAIKKRTQAKPTPGSVAYAL